MKTSFRIAILSMAAFAAMQTGVAQAQGAKELWSEDSSAMLSFGSPDEENAPQFPAKGQFVEPETDQRVSTASAAFGDPDSESIPLQKGCTYFAGEPAGELHRTL
jgi:hypothetical protein